MLSHKKSSKTLSSARLHVLCGNFMNVENWQPPKKKLLIFVSSTFTDTHEERNILLNKVQEYLREVARQYGIEVTFIDMRYGVQAENTLDHMTWIACHRELTRCFEESAGVFFLSLQGDKYGYMPLPKTFDQKAFEKRMLEYEQQETDASILKETKTLVSEWYQLDTNAIPPVYILKNLDSLTDHTFWKIALPRLRELFKNVAFDSFFPDGIIDRSVTEYEVKAAFDLCMPKTIYSRSDDGISLVDNDAADMGSNKPIDRHKRSNGNISMLDFSGHGYSDEKYSLDEATIVNALMSNSQYSLISMSSINSRSVVNPSSLLNSQMSWAKIISGLSTNTDRNNNNNNNPIGMRWIRRNFMGEITREKDLKKELFDTDDDETLHKLTSLKNFMDQKFTEAAEGCNIELMKTFNVSIDAYNDKLSVEWQVGN